MRVFVVNAYPSRTPKYDDRYECKKGILWENVEEKELSKRHFFWSAKLKYRQMVTACSLSHQALIQLIIDEDLKDVFIIEDDLVIDFDDLNKFMENPPDTFCYIGGHIHAPLMKNFNTFAPIKLEIRETLVQGINKIKPDLFRLGSTSGYYIPNAKIALLILSSIRKEKQRAIDTEFIRLQKKGIITDFYYPALATVVMEEAKTGFTVIRYPNIIIDNQRLY